MNVHAGTQRKIKEMPENGKGEKLSPENVWPRQDNFFVWPGAKKPRANKGQDIRPPEGEGTNRPLRSPAEPGISLVLSLP